VNTIKYEFNISGVNTFFEVDLERTLSLDIQGPDWTKLEYCQCSTCPLDLDKSTYCPAAYDMYKVAESFSDLLSIEMCEVKVISADRTYIKTCAAQEGLRSLFGVIMASSACPVLGRMKPMALQHLPFSNLNDTLVRLSGAYLITQYMKSQNGEEAQWDFNELMGYFRELSDINKQLMMRLGDVSNKDSVLNAIYSFVAFSELAEMTFDSLMNNLKAAYLDAF